tara:strand:- start:719 stop:889 length:171 start_codon:yes stop_codon:yes gene_type:complete
MRYAKNALEAAANVLAQEEGRSENAELNAVCVSIGQKARVLSNMLQAEEDSILSED